MDDRGAKVGVLAYGTSHHAVEEARDRLRGQHELETDYMRIRGFPFTEDVEAWILAHDHVYLVEQNRDAQMARMLTMDYPEVAVKLRSVLHYDGLPLDACTIVEQILGTQAGQEALPSHRAKANANAQKGDA